MTSNSKTPTFIILASSTTDSLCLNQVLCSFLQRISISYIIQPVSSYEQVKSVVLENIGPSSPIFAAVFIGFGAKTDLISFLFSELSEEIFLNLKLKKIYVFDKELPVAENASKQNTLIGVIENQRLGHTQVSLSLTLLRNAEKALKNKSFLRFSALNEILETTDVLWALAVASYSSKKQEEIRYVLRMLKSVLSQKKLAEISVKRSFPPVYKESLGLMTALKHSEELNAKVKLISTEGEKVLKRVLAKSGISLKEAANIRTNTTACFPRSEINTEYTFSEISNEKFKNLLYALKEEKLPLKEFETVVLFERIQVESFAEVLRFVLYKSFWGATKLLQPESLKNNNKNELGAELSCNKKDLETTILTETSEESTEEDFYDNEKDKNLLKRENNTEFNNSQDHFNLNLTKETKSAFQKRNMFFSRAIDILEKKMLKKTRYFRHLLIDLLISDNFNEEIEEIGHLIIALNSKKWKKHELPLLVAVVNQKEARIKTFCGEKPFLVFREAFETALNKVRAVSHKFGSLEAVISKKLFRTFIEQLYFVIDELNIV